MKRTVTKCQYLVVYTQGRFQGFGSGAGCSGSLCEEQPGLPHAGHSEFQPAPTRPPQGTAQPLRQGDGALEKAYLRNDKTQEQQCGCSAVRWGEPTEVVQHWNR